MYPAARRIGGKLKNLVPGTRVSYTAAPAKNQSVATPEMLRKMKSGSGKTSYKIPKTPKSSGSGWGH